MTESKKHVIRDKMDRVKNRVKKNYRFLTHKSKPSFHRRLAPYLTPKNLLIGGALALGIGILSFF